MLSKSPCYLYLSYSFLFKIGKPFSLNTTPSTYKPFTMKSSCLAKITVIGDIIESEQEDLKGEFGPLLQQ